jgi:hypothetical protein
MSLWTEAFRAATHALAALEEQLNVDLTLGRLAQSSNYML